MTTPQDANQIAGSNSNSRASSAETVDSDEPAVELQNHAAFSQMERTLERQAEMCGHYMRAYQGHYIGSMSKMLEAYMELTSCDLDVLRSLYYSTNKLPRFKLRNLSLYCRPHNDDLKQNEMSIEIRTHLMPVERKSNLYVVAEYGGPTARAAQSVGKMVDTLIQEFARDPNKTAECLFGGNLQLDKVRASPYKPYWDLRNFHTSYERPIKFWLDRQAKWRAVKLTFYETMAKDVVDREVGSVIIRLECLNNNATSIIRLPVLKGSVDTGGGVEIKLRIREPLLECSMRYFEEELLILT